MKRVVAAFLLFCLGMMIPVGASPFRFCLLEGGIRMSGVQMAVDLPDGRNKCCPDCDPASDESDPCCVEVEKLPDSSTPQLPVVLPPVVMSCLPEVPWVAPASVECECVRPWVFPMIRGPASPAAYRSVLEVWRM